MKRLFKGAAIITVNDKFDIISNGMLGIKDKEIKYVGEYSSEFEKEFDADSIIHANNKILMPGFINMHTHLPMTLFRGYGSNLAQSECAKEGNFPQEISIGEEDIKSGVQTAVAEMLLSGTTMCTDTYAQAEIVADVMHDWGMRGIVSYGYDGAESIQKTLQLSEYCNSLGEGRLKTIASLRLKYDGTDDEKAIKKYIEDAKINGKKIHVHIADTHGQTQKCVNSTGLTPVKYLEKLGAFKAGVIGVNCLAVSDEDIDILKSNNVSVVYSPTSNAKTGSGFAPVKKMLDKGINVCLGTGSGANNNNMDMIEEMHLGSIIAKGFSGEASALNAQETIRMATINGAKALGIDNSVGSLEKGKKADIIMFNQASPFFLPESEICNNVVYSASRNELEITMVDGKVLMERGKLLKLSYEKLAGDFEESAAKLTTQKQ